MAVIDSLIFLLLLSMVRILAQLQLPADEMCMAKIAPFCFYRATNAVAFPKPSTLEFFFFCFALYLAVPV